jgi:hypothetical protein
MAIQHPFQPYAPKIVVNDYSGLWYIHNKNGG